MIVDCQTHWHPRSYFEALSARRDYPRAHATDDGGFVIELSDRASFPIMPLLLDLDQQLEDAARAGIDVLVTQSGAFGVDELPAAEGRELATMLNEAAAAAEAAHPGRVVALARVPLQDPAMAVDVARDAVQRLGLRGICIGSNVAGESIATPERRPFYAEVERLGVPIFLHPTRTIVGDQLERYALEYVVGFMFDSSVAALDLVFSGTMHDHPDLQIVHPHVGGMLPYVASRLDFEYRQPWAMNRTLPAPPTEYLKRFYVDTVSDTPGALGLAEAFYGPERLLYASDYPYWPMDETLRFTREAVSSPAVVDGVLGGNAAALLGL